jgi:hypothetical protein
MTYDVINNLPIDYEFSTKTEQQLKMYQKWFGENKTQRLTVLINTIKSDPNFTEWVPDFSANSLKGLGKWLKQNIRIEKLSPERYEQKREKVPDYISINDWEMTTETYSKLVDAGIYFGEVFINTYPGLKWEQSISKIRKDANRGHMVIKGFGRKELNPLRTMYVIGTGLATNQESENCLFELYHVWKKYLPIDI